jgi:hypothetical protein
MCLTAMDEASPGQRVVMQIPGDGKAGGDAAYLGSLVNTARVAGARAGGVGVVPESGGGRRAPGLEEGREGGAAGERTSGRARSPRRSPRPRARPFPPP